MSTPGPIAEETGPDVDPEPPLFSAAEQDQFLALLAKGASPAAACAALALPVGSYLRSRAELRGFRQREAQVQSLLSQNVLASLYQAAMKGSVPAMTAWLKQQTSSTTEGDSPSGDPLDDLTDDQLVELARSIGMDVPEGLDAAQ